MLTGAILAPLGMAGCDLLAGGSPAETEASPPPPALLTMEEIPTSDQFRAPRPVYRGARGIDATEEHPAAMLVRTRHDTRYGARVCAVGGDAAVEIALHEATVAAAVDGSAKASRLYSAVPAGPGFRTTMHLSADLGTWTPIELDGAVHIAPLTAGDGLLLGREGTTYPIWSVADDGTTTALTPLAVPEGVQWDPFRIVRRDDLIVVLLEVSDADRPAAPATLRSTDAGRSWSAPEPLPGEVRDIEASSLHLVGDDVVVTGTTRHSPDWGEGWSFRRPLAWSSPDGTAMVQEEIPLPEYGLDGWTFDRKGRVDASTPMDFVDLGIGSAVRGVDGDLRLPVHHERDLRTAARDAAGTWRITARGPGDFEDFLDAVVAGDDEEFVIATPRSIVTTRIGPTDLGRAWYSDDLLEVAPAREFSAASGTAGPATATFQWAQRARPLPDSGADSGSEEDATTRTGNVITLAEEGLVVLNGIPVGLETWERLKVHGLDTERSLVTGLEEDEEGVLRLRAQVLAGESWAPAEGLDGVEATDSSYVPQLSLIGDTYYFPTWDYETGEDGVDRIVTTLHESDDGVTWTHRSLLDPETLTEPENRRGAQFQQVVDVEGTLIGIGAVLGEDDYYRAATVLLGEESWTAQLLAEAPNGSHLIAAHPRGHQVAVQYWWSGRLDTALLNADGTVDTGGAVWDGNAVQDTGVDLGDGILLAAGSMDVGDDGETAVGTCVWASRDDGETWTPNPVPNLLGRFFTAELQLDGEDVVLVTADDERPLACRILAPKQELLGAAEESG